MKTTISVAALDGAPSIINTGGYVSQNKLKKSSIELKQAEFLDLLAVPVSTGAKSLVHEVVEVVKASEPRRRPRGAGERGKLEIAVGAVLGGLLCASLIRGACVYRTMDRGSFDDGVGYRTARAALDALEANGLICRHPGIRFQQAIGDDDRHVAGYATRFMMTDALRELANRYGVTPETAKQDFRRNYPASPPKLPHPLKILAMDKRTGANRPRGGGTVRLPTPSTIEAKALRAEVDVANAVFSGCAWSGCQPPRMYRAFRGDFGLGGRWIVAGALPIQMMAQDDRLLIRIDDQTVAEIDATASHLSILAAAAGVTRLPAAPYEVTGYERATVKAAVVATLGIGRFPGGWPVRMLHRNPALEGITLAGLTDRLGLAYPWLADPAAVLGVDRRLVALRLQRIEAEILTRAMVPFWHERVPVVPIHDGLLCPLHHVERARAGLIAAYRNHGQGAVVDVTVRASISARRL